MSDFTFAIKKEKLSKFQIDTIRAYKTFILQPPSYVEEYQQGWKFYIDVGENVENIKWFFKNIGIICIDSSFFVEEWNY